MRVAAIKMPQLGESVTEGTVDRWLKNVGDFVKLDEPLVDVTTDKVNAEIPSPLEGTLVKISVAAGQTVAIGAEIAQIETANETTAPPLTPALGPIHATTPGAVRKATNPADRAHPSPATHRLIDEHGIDPSKIVGTGGGDRTTRRDVVARRRATHRASAAEVESPTVSASSATDTNREEIVRLTVMRRSIAEHMVRSVTTAPHAWSMVEVDVTEIVRFRTAEKAGFDVRNGVPLTYLPFVIQVVCEALKDNPYLNSSWTESGILLKRYYNIGIAVAVPDGLIVPVIRDADRLGFIDLARAAHDLAARARSKRLAPEDVRGGTFTITNTGALGLIAGMAIINQPQAAIMTTDAIVKRPVYIGDQISARHIMNLCLSIDHRVIDGVQASRFLRAVKQRLETWKPEAIGR